ncbi:hypothetical protein GCM10020000_38090 [Streptomyces olivoverticillatus]
MSSPPWRTTPPKELAFSRLLPAAPALAAAMWPVLPTVLLGTVCLMLMIGLGFLFPGLGTWWTAGGIVAVTVAAAYGSHVRLQRERTLFQVRLVADAAQQVVLSPLPDRCGGVEIESLYIAAAAEARIGGDFYEVVDTPYGVRLLIGDVRGKGLPAVGGRPRRWSTPSGKRPTSSPIWAASRGAWRPAAPDTAPRSRPRT